MSIHAGERPYGLGDSILPSIIEDDQETPTQPDNGDRESRSSGSQCTITLTPFSSSSQSTTDSDIVSISKPCLVGPEEDKKEKKTLQEDNPTNSS